MEPKPSPAMKALIFWIIWVSICVGIFVIYSVLGSDKKATEATLSLINYLPFLPLLITTALRWLYFEKIKYTDKALPCFIIGLAMAEAVLILGLVLNSSMQQEYLIVTLMGVLQYIPLFALKSDRFEQ